MRKLRWMIMVAGICAMAFGVETFAQEAAGDIAVAEGAEVDAGPSTGFGAVIMGGGMVGLVLWLSIFGMAIAGVYFIVDGFLNVKETKMIPDGFLARVQEAMEQGDIIKANEICDTEPNPLANILGAAFTNVEDGFDAVQDAVTIAGDMETEKLMQRVNYLNIVGNLAPLLGLLGTVAGMIFAFATLATAGAAGASLLAMNISMALWTTAAGLVIAIPALAFFYFFKNKASRIILNMEMLTLDEIKILRHVEMEEE